MQTKTEKWGIVIKTQYSTTYIEKDNLKEVQAFFNEEHKLNSFKLDNYIVYPPYTNLSHVDLNSYGVYIGKPIVIGDDD